MTLAAFARLYLSRSGPGVGKAACVLLVRSLMIAPSEGKIRQMPTRIAVFCDKLLEAGWLAALIIAPLFFNVYSSRVFEPDKISLIRSLAVLMAAAWIVRQLERGIPRTRPQELWHVLRETNPLMVPTLAVVLVYLISTVFSVVPEVSLWGSYQRMQGTYTTFSYIVIFLVTLSTLRTRHQFNRAINTAIVVSFPISFYGLLQHYKLDPLPWGGDTTLRVASNMGNSIFVAAFLILIVPLTAARWIESLTRITAELQANGRRAVSASAVIALGVLAVAQAVDFTLGVGALAALFVFSVLFALNRKLSWRDVLLVTTYTVILATQFVALFFTQSRGPWLGLGGAVFAFAVLYALALRARRVVLGAIGLAIVSAVFLVAFNLPGSPLDPLRGVPYVGRLGEILDSKSPTAQVRELIWQGAVQLISPHAPIWSPTTGDDPLNAVRPLVGYGPEAMYVAFNSFYPAELAHLEQRNASPDRSHNETLDSLVTTGLFGFAAYILLFVSIFYFGLKWLGVISSARERNLFVALWLAGGIIATVIFGLWRGWHFVGVALPAGMILGLFIFVAGDALRRDRAGATSLDPQRSLWLSALIAALIGHFIEIHFGIAIVSTRTYFWFYSALLIILGTNRLVDAGPSSVPVPEPAPAALISERERRRKRKRSGEGARAGHHSETARGAAGKARAREIPLGPVLVATAIATSMILTLAFEFINNQAGVPSALQAVQHSLFFKANYVSIGVFLLVLFTWVVAGLVLLGEELRNWTVAPNSLGLAVALFAVLSLTAFIWYVVFQMRWLTQAGDLTDGFINVLGLYYVAIFLVVAGLALALSLDAAPPHALFLRAPANAVVAPVLLFGIVGAIYLTNFTGISADILYKSGGNYDNTGAYESSIAIYQRALVLQPNQDFYALFLGRAYLEGARQTSDTAQRNQYLAKSEQILRTAQQLNSLNTDHTANLARLNRVWAALVADPAQKTLHNQQSSQYYQMAIRLSPNTAYLYNEWSQTYSQMGDLEQARATLEKSLKIDSQFGQTYLYLGDYYRAKQDWEKAADSYLLALTFDWGALSGPDSTPLPEPMATLARPEFLPRAISAYRALIAENPSYLPARYAIADLYKRSGQLDKAREELVLAVSAAPADIVARLTLVNLLSETGQIDAAVTSMRGVMELVPPQSPQYARFADFNAQLQNLQRAIQTAQKSPNDVSAHRSVAGMWKARGQPQFAVPEYQAVARLAPGDYDAHKNLAFLNLQLYHLDEAQSALATAASLAPENEKPLWQNLQMALNSQKAQQLDQALKQAQAALALSTETDRPAVQAYVTMLQDQTGSR